jgi:HPt (histidine-containing phosphotransfer) domain-containing protein
MPDDERRSLQAGCTAHLSKPFSRSQLRRALARQQPGDERGDAVAVRPEIAAFANAPWPLPGLASLEGFDLATALARMDGNIGLYVRVAQAATQTMNGWPERFVQAQAKGDAGLALRMAHDLKSSAATLGALALAAAALRLEQALRAAQPQPDEVAAAQAAVQAPLAAVLARLLPSSE